MNYQQKMKYKEVIPEKTIEKIKDILEDINLDVYEEWLTSSSIESYSLRLWIKGTKLGTNGKGVTKELARASAYAELLERYQNIWLSRALIRWKSNFQFNYFIDEIELTAEDIVLSNNSFVKMYFSKRNMNNASFEEKVNNFKSIHKLEKNLFRGKDTYTSIPFYNVLKKSIEYLPYCAYSVMYASNGMCAGNSSEEALIQGVSEVLERYIQKRIFDEKPSLPEIPDWYLDKYTYLKEYIEKMRLIDGYEFELKDCSFGGKYPVAALVIIEKNTGRYGIKLGCHPDYSIAIERCITEAAQGNDITEYVNRSKLDFSNKDINDPINIFNCFRIGIAQYPYEIMNEKNTFEFVEMPSVSEMSNREILNYMVNNLIKDGYEVLIHDVSYLGFPSYQVIVPEMSEMMYMTDEDFKAINLKLLVSELLNYPENIKKKHCRYIISIMNYYAKSFMDNEMRSHYGVLVNFKLPCEEMNLGWLYLSSMCEVILGNYKEAAEEMSHIIKYVKPSDENSPFYLSVYHYLKGMEVIADHNEVIAYLEKFFDSSIVSRIDDIFKESEKVIQKQYPKHNYLHTEELYENKCCDYAVYSKAVDTFRCMQAKNPVNQIELANIFSE